MTEAGPRPQRFAALDAWRGICAIVVALEHLNIANALHENRFIHHGARFVDFFFVLSGFVIAHAYRDRLQRGRRGETRSFLVRRVGRLWPLHAVILAVLVLGELGFLVGGKSLGRAAFSDRNTLPTLPLNLLLLHAWGMFGNLTWNTPSWSISVEMFAYVLYAAVGRLPARFYYVGVASLAVAGIVVLELVAPTGMQSTYDFGLARCAFGFMSGVLVRALWERHPLRVGTLGELAMAAVVLVGVALLPTGPVAIAVTPLFALAVWVFASDSGVVSRVLRARPLQALGAWSYSIYMVHATIMFGILIAAMVATKHGLHVFARVDDIATIIGPTWLTTAIALGYLALVVAVSSLTYRYIELPGQRWFGRLARGREAQP